jgi:hypothetical protein
MSIYPATAERLLMNDEYILRKKTDKMQLLVNSLQILFFGIV